MTTNITTYKNADNFFVAFWNGDLSLATSFWGVYFLLSTIVTGIAGYLMNFLPGIMCIGIIILFLIYSFVGLYRSVIKNPSTPFINFLVYLSLFGRLIKIILLVVSMFGVI